MAGVVGGGVNHLSPRPLPLLRPWTVAGGREPVQVSPAEARALVAGGAVCVEAAPGPGRPGVVPAPPPGELPVELRGRTLVVVDDGSGVEAARVARQLQEAGARRVLLLEGGWPAWEREDWSEAPE